MLAGFYKVPRPSILLARKAIAVLDCPFISSSQSSAGLSLSIIILFLLQRGAVDSYFFNMPSFRQLLSIAPVLLAVAQSQGVIQSAQGTKGSVASPPLQVDLTGADANIINNAEIVSNVVNECGRTLLGGNIDVGEHTESQLANKTVTSVTKGSTVAVTIKQGSADGAGPYSCDLDPTGNANGATGQQNLTVAEMDSADGNIALTVTMPTDLACAGGTSSNRSYSWT